MVVGILLYIVLAIVVFFSIFIFFYCKNHSKRVLQKFLNSHSNIMVLVHSQEITMINRAGLKVFGYESLKSFKLSHADISDFFLKNDEQNSKDHYYYGIEYIDKYSYGKKWIETIANRSKNQVKVKMFSKEDMMDRYYQIRVSKLDSGNDYSLSFTDITDLESKRLRSQREAEYDPLTKIYNRVKVNEVLKEMTFSAKKYNYNLTLILFDIDHFKQVNDLYGHSAGDSVLVELSSLIKGLLRSGDLFARWGGEEFIILLNGSIKEGEQLASRLRAEVERFPFNIVKNVTCSFGVTEFRSGDTEAQFFQRVDEALYKAKENGRNQVITK